MSWTERKESKAKVKAYLLFSPPFGNYDFHHQLIEKYKMDYPIGSIHEYKLINGRGGFIGSNPSLGVEGYGEFVTRSEGSLIILFQKISS